MLNPRASGAALAVIFVGVFSAALDGQRGALTVRVAGVDLSPARVGAVVVDADGRQADAAFVTLRAEGLQPGPGDSLEIRAPDGALIFRGEVAAVEGSAPRAIGPVTTIRGFDRLHRLTRATMTRTFVGQSDADIGRQLALDAGLEFQAIGAEAFLTHDLVVQHNQTDLDFLRGRAALIGYDVFTDDTTLHLEKRRDGPAALVGCGRADLRLDALVVRLASPAAVKEVSVRGWDLASKQEITGRARQTVIGLSPAASEIDPPPAALSLGFVEALQTAAAAYAAAAGTLSALTADELSAEMRVEGSAALTARSPVMLRGTGVSFDGEYVVTQVSHRANRWNGERWHTLLRVVRADRAVFLLPEVGDQVLVAFEHGDVNRPIIVGTLWNPATSSPAGSPCIRRP